MFDLPIDCLGPDWKPALTDLCTYLCASRRWSNLCCIFPDTMISARMSANKTVYLGARQLRSVALRPRLLRRPPGASNWPCSTVSIQETMSWTTSDWMMIASAGSNIVFFGVEGNQALTELD